MAFLDWLFTSLVADMVEPVRRSFFACCSFFKCYQHYSLAIFVRFDYVTMFR